MACGLVVADTIGRLFLDQQEGAITFNDGGDGDIGLPLAGVVIHAAILSPAAGASKKKRRGMSPAFSMMLESTALFLFAVFMVFVLCVLAVHFCVSCKHRSNGYDREHCGKWNCDQ